MTRSLYMTLPDILGPFDRACHDPERARLRRMLPASVILCSDFPNDATSVRASGGVMRGRRWMYDYIAAGM